LTVDLEELASAFIAGWARTGSGGGIARRSGLGFCPFAGRAECAVPGCCRPARAGTTGPRRGCRSAS